MKAFQHWGYLKFWAVIIFLGDHDADNILWLVHFRYAMFSATTVVSSFLNPFQVSVNLLSSNSVDLI